MPFSLRTDATDLHDDVLLHVEPRDQGITGIVRPTRSR